ncbi:hypothetical protein MTR_0358s0010 [Medicago truncatula]|uniref:Uncharacterized protein n=1 Tax=Medicago truncatula TaxID=3880 RepID=A0A072TFQ0_MEDTR|nr:hypothetical protein MTR_0358s0010 [Medicago truncatula]
MSAMMVKEFELLEQFRDLSLVCEMSSKSVKLGMLKIDSVFLKSIKEAQKVDVKFVDFLVASNQTEDSDIKIDDQGVLRFRGRICIPDDDEMNKMILEESHRSSLSQQQPTMDYLQVTHKKSNISKQKGLYLTSLLSLNPTQRFNCRQLVQQRLQKSNKSLLLWVTCEARASARHGEFRHSKASKVQLKSQNYEILHALWSSSLGEFICSLWRAATCNSRGKGKWFARRAMNFIPREAMNFIPREGER